MVKITSLGLGASRLEVDGVDIPSLRSYTVTHEAGEMPIVTAEMLAVEGFEAEFPDARVNVHLNFTEVPGQFFQEKTESGGLKIRWVPEV